LSTQHELLDKAIARVGNRYLTTMLIAKRIRQLHHGARPRVPREESDSYFTIAVREIAEGHLSMQLRTHTSPEAAQEEAVTGNGLLQELPSSLDMSNQGVSGEDREES
jgi:DNA-directed RNA polymerase omega subunit